MTFGDGVTAGVLGRGTLNVDDFPWFKNVLHVDGLKDNLISASQICVLNLNINFNHEKCIVIDVDDKYILEGIFGTHLLLLHTCVTR